MTEGWRKPPMDFKEHLERYIDASGRTLDWDFVREEVKEAHREQLKIYLQIYELFISYEILELGLGEGNDARI
jgi:hypothetical protein